MMLVNLTPHPLNLRRMDGTTLTLPPSGMVARVASTDRVFGQLDGLAVHQVVLGQEIEGLPDQQDGTYYVCSLLAAQAAKVQGRTDVYAPGPAVRDADGRVIGADGLSIP
jgi:hypothetical protein